MLTELSVRNLHEGLKRGDFSSVEITKAYIEKVEGDKFNAFVLKTPEYALKAADKADRIISSTKNFGHLTGIPFGVKDIFCTKGVRTTACSRMLENFVPIYESTVTQKMHDAGAVMLGKLNMDEFAMGSANINSCFGPSINPHKGKHIDQQLVTGGSSGGSAAAVAGSLCPCSIGSDTGGSVRQPASFCGIVGIKPTYGRCSRWGMIAFASSLDQAGVMAKNVLDAGFVLRAICGYDKKDSTSSNLPPPEINFEQEPKKIKLGIPKDLDLEGISSGIMDLWAQAAKKMEKLGVKIVEVSLPNLHYALPAYYILSSAEAASNLARYDGIRYGSRISNAENVEKNLKLTRGEFFGNEVKRRILTGNYILSHGYEKGYYKRAQIVRRILKRDYLEAFSKVDAILMPTTPCDAFEVNAKIDPILMYLNDVFTVSVNLAGLPAISVPAGNSENGLPLGLQIIGKYYQETSMLSIASILEKQYDSYQAD